MILRYALKNIGRAPARNVLIGIIVFVIATAGCIALSVQEAAKSAREAKMANMAVSGHIYVDRAYLMQNMTPGADGSDMSGLTLEELKTYAEAPSVEGFTYYEVISPNGAGGLEALSSAQAPAGQEGQEGQTGQGGQGGQAQPLPQQPQDPQQLMSASVFQGDFTLVGYADDAAMEDFTDGTCAITSGSMFEEGTSEYVCVVEEQLAALNDLSVGDTIKICNPNDESETYKLEITGIYKNSSMATNVTTSASDPSNAILTSAAVLDDIVAASEDASDEPLQSTVTGTYFFASVADYDSFETEAREMGLSEKYTVTSTDIAAFEQSMVLLDNLKTFALTFLAITFVIGALVLVVISIFSMRDRIYEIGALAAMGMKKQAISALLISEILIVSVAAIALGCAIGSAVSVPLTNTLLSSQVEQQKEEDAQSASAFGRMDASEEHEKPRGGDVEGEVDYVDSIEFSTDVTVLLEMAGIGLGLVLVSGAAAIFFILRYDPKQILTMRD